MEINVIKEGGCAVAVVESAEVLIVDTQSALDWMMTVKHTTECSRLALNKQAVSEDFFVLSTCLAGEVLQKFINYQVKFALFGDFSSYTSKPLKDFICESNQGSDIFFVPTQKEAIQKLLAAKE